MNILVECLSKHKELSREVIECLAKVTNGNSKQYKSKANKISFLQTSLIVEANLKILFSERPIDLIFNAAKENLENESFCELISIVIGSMGSLSATMNLKTLFLESERIFFILTLLDRYSKNKVICESLAFVLKALLLNIRNVLRNGSEKELSTFTEGNGIDVISKVLDKQAQERKIVLGCIHIFICLFNVKGNQNFFFSVFFIYYLFMKISGIQ